MKKTTTNTTYASYKSTNLNNYLNESGTATLSQTFIPMKLYTEEQVMKAYNMGIDDGHNGAISLQINELSLTPIELPSDLKDFHKWIEDNEWYFNPISFNGVIQYRWVKEFWIGQETTDELYKIYIEEQILNQNK